MFVFFKYIYSYEPSCNSCKWFKPQSDGYNLCGFFKNTIYQNKKTTIINEYAVHCRNNPDMCGKNGVFYEPVFEKVKEELSNLLDQYEFIKNKEYGEVNEVSELEEIEKDMVNLINRIHFLEKWNKNIDNV